MRIQVKILIFIFAVVLLTGGGATLIGRSVAMNIVEDEISDHMITTAQSQSQHIQDILESREEEAELMARIVGVYVGVLDTGFFGLSWDSATWLSQDFLINMASAGAHVDGAMYVRIKDEGPVIEYSSFEDIVGMDASKWEFFLEGSKATFIGDYASYEEIFGLDASYSDVFSEDDDDFVLVLASPVRAGEKLSGVIVLMGGEQILSDIAANTMGLGETGETYILNEDGYMITESRFLDDAVLRQKVDIDGTQESSDEPGEIDWEVISTTNYMGDKVLQVTHRLPEVGWTVVVETGYSEAFAPVANLTRIMLWSLLGVLFLGALVSILMARAISRPIMKLQEGAEEIIKGNLDRRIGLNSKDEVGELSRAFDTMVSGLQERTVELEETIDEHKRTEEELKKSEAELHKLLADLERSNEELQQFAYIASHDLQEPLRMVSSYTQLLARRYKGILDTEADEYISFAVEGASRMKELINAFLYYTWVSTRGKPFEPVDSETILENALYNLEILIEENEAVVTHDQLPPVVADKTQIGQLLQNLIGNAIKFHGEESPRIHVTAVRQGEEWIFSVSDNGIGIESQYADRIFEIFQRLHTKAEYPGTGIGLSVCRKIVERHGGRIWMESEPGKGTTFYFTISIKEDLDDYIGTGGRQDDQHLVGRR